LSQGCVDESIDSRVDTFVGSVHQRPGVERPSDLTEQDYSRPRILLASASGLSARPRLFARTGSCPLVAWQRPSAWSTSVASRRGDPLLERPSFEGLAYLGYPPCESGLLAFADREVVGCCSKRLLPAELSERAQEREPQRCIVMVTSY